MQDILEAVKNIADKAGALLLEYYDKPALKIEEKSDNTPVTEADIAASTYIVKQLAELIPNCPILCEETKLPPPEERLSWQKYWCVDPLDGTKEFIHRTGEFTINIALIKGNEPVLSVLSVPFFNEQFWAIKGQGAYDKNKRLQTFPVTEPLRCLLSRFHTPEKLLARLPKGLAIEPIQCGSALKFARLAQGQGDFYVRAGHTCEWDTAAGQLILEEAGGQVIKSNAQRLQYNTKTDLINPPFLATATTEPRWVEMLRNCTI